MNALFGIAGVQMAIVPEDVDQNLSAMRKYCKFISSVFAWTDMIIFPELCLIGISAPHWREQALTLDDPPVQGFREMAAKAGKWLVPGSFIETEEGKYYNTALVISPAGEIAAKYRKIFPWQPLEETEPGNEICVFEIPGKGTFGLAICYDMWFPELSRSLAYLGAEVIIHPSLTATSDRPLEQVIVQAASIHNQCYTININGIEEGLGGGTSLLAGPDGRVLQKLDGTARIVTEVLDMDKVRATREFGTLGLCQNLKQLKESGMSFPARPDPDGGDNPFTRLGKVRKYQTLDSE